VRGASLVIANDCGPAHFAHIHDVPRISLFDSAINAAHWFFAGRRGRLRRSPAPDEIGRIPAGAILALANELLALSEPAAIRSAPSISGDPESRR
jgi:hypothetical protein